MIRRLPVYLIIDLSTSMQGEKIKGVNEGIRLMLQSLRKNPMALETVYLSIITFSNDARQIVPLTPVYQVQLPELTAKGWTNIEAGLSMLIKCINSEVIKPDKETSPKGDWKPIVFMFSDGGESRGKWKNVLDQLEPIRKKLAEFKAIPLYGGHYKTHLNELASIAGGEKNIIQLEKIDETNIIELFRRISVSISQSVEVMKS